MNFSITIRDKNVFYSIITILLGFSKHTYSMASRVVYSKYRESGGSN